MLGGRGIRKSGDAPGGSDGRVGSGGGAAGRTGSCGGRAEGLDAVRGAELDGSGGGAIEGLPLEPPSGGSVARFAGSAERRAPGAARSASGERRGLAERREPGGEARAPGAGRAGAELFEPSARASGVRRFGSVGESSESDTAAMILDAPGHRGTLGRMRGIWVISGTLALSMLLAQACAPREAEPTPSGGETSGSESAGEGGEGAEAGTGSGTSEPDLVVGEDACTTDADCVPADCCHAAACVAVANAPSCGDAMCTMDCRFGTIDCGGGCLCHEGRCAARLMRVPDLQAPPEGGEGSTAPE